jgi:DNA-binding transcriptional LysR family regulator
VIGDALFVDRVVNIIDEGIDVAVRIGHLPDSGFTAIRVGEVRHLVCGAPEYFSAHGTPLTPAELAAHRTVTSTGAWMEWRFMNVPPVAVRPRLFTNTVEGALQAAIRGWGITRVLSYQAAPALAEGRLKRVLAAYEEAPVPVHVIHAEGRRTTAKVRAFVDFAVENLRTNPMINEGRY